MNAYLDGFRRAFDFSGRSTRREFWLFTLFSALAVFVALQIDWFLLRATGTAYLGTLVSFVQMVPGVAVGVRRLHDTGRSGWWYLVALVPLVGLVLLVVMWCGGSETAAEGKAKRPRSTRFGGDRTARGAAAASLSMMIAEVAEVSGAAAELVAAGADDGPDDDGPDDDGFDSDFDPD